MVPALCKFVYCYDCLDVKRSPGIDRHSVVTVNDVDTVDCSGFVTLLYCTDLFI